MVDIGNNPTSVPSRAERRKSDAALGKIACAGRSGRFYGAAGTPWINALTIPVAGKAIHPGATLRMRGLLAKYSPFNAGCNYRVQFQQEANTVTVNQATIPASLATVPLSLEMGMSYDRRWGFLHSRSINMYGQIGNLVAQVYSEDTVQATNAPSSISPRAQSAGPAFASYSAPPAVETVLIDFDQDFNILVQLSPAANDAYEVLSFDVEQLSHGPQGMNFANAKATLFPGDSLTEGTGATTGNDWVSALGKTRTGRPLIGLGLGGQMITAIVNRVLADPVAGKYWDMAFWGGINDVDSTGGGAAWWAVVQAQLARLMAFRDPSARAPLILNYHESTAWTAGQKSAATYVNAQLAATYGANVVDIAAVINGNAGYYSDAIHLTDSGYAAVAAAVHAKMTAQGWAA